MYKKWLDWQGGALDVWEEKPASDIGVGLIRHEWQGEKYSLLQKGTTLKADIMNNLQMGLDFLVDSNHTVVNSEDHYVITIDGLKTTNSNPDGYELVENVHFSLKITEDNSNGITKLIINNDSYDLQKKENGSLVELDKLDLKADKVCKVYYDGTEFIIDASSLPATDNTSGIMTKNDVRTIVSEATGGKYDGMFGSDLTSITEGKTYIYFDSNNVGTVYKALTTTTDATGFTVPDTTNFSNISNSELHGGTVEVGMNYVKYKNGLLHQFFNATAGGNNVAKTGLYPIPFIVAPPQTLATHNGANANGTNVSAGATGPNGYSATTSYSTDIGITLSVWGRWK